MRKIWIAFLMMAPCLFAHGDEKNCKEVSAGGTIVGWVEQRSHVGRGEGFKRSALQAAPSSGRNERHGHYL
jgi:hypothetical protein